MNLKHLLATTTLCLGLSGGTVGAITIVAPTDPLDGTDVGSLDPLQGFTTSLANSNPTTETNWARSVVGDPTLTYAGKVESVGIFSTDVLNTFAFSLDPSPYPTFFIVKNARYWALYENSQDYGWGVFSTDGIPSDFNVPGNFVISHYSGFGEIIPPPPPPPGEEPPRVPDGGTTITLLGLTLLGLGGTRRLLKRD